MRFVCRCLAVWLAAWVCCTSCKDEEKEVPYRKLPELAQQFLSTYFENVAVGRIDRSSDEPRYRVRLNNGFEVRFFGSGEWQEVNGNGQAVAYSMQLELLPLGLVNYVGENFPAAEVTIISRNGSGHEVKLNTVPATWVGIDSAGNITVNAAP